VEEALAGGLPAVLFRDKDLPDPEARTLLDPLRAATAARGASLLVSGRPALARQVGADGVHLPEGQARPPTHLWDGPLSVAAHDGSGLDRARRVGAAFALLSPLFPTSTHPGSHTLGPEAFGRLAAASPVPVLALGGITPENGDRALGAGAWGLACIDALLAAPDPGSEVRRFLAVIEGNGG
jgi:thiamine-phosphate diphosphorylase